MIGRILKARRLLASGVLDVVLVVLANYIAFWLRFDGAIPTWAMTLFIQMLPLLILMRIVLFIPFRLHEGMWRYTSLWDLRNIVGATVISTICFHVVVRWVFGQIGYPRSVYLIDAMVLILFLGGVRLLGRMSRGLGGAASDKRILVYGAGDAGERIVRDLMSNPVDGFRAIGFVDDDPGKTGKRIHGVKVLGTRVHLPSIMAETAPHMMVIAMANAAPKALREVVRSLQPYRMAIKTLPDWRNILDGRIGFSQIRDLAVEDLLERAPVGLNAASLQTLLAGKRVMVTGAGGSIGSELCRQIARTQPAALILFERYENSLYTVNNELADAWQLPLYPVIGDVTDQPRLESVMSQYSPQIIFHAAAYKHVPLMEDCPCEAVKNNIMGTRLVASTADRYDVERFVMLSTDKAVNPISIMGATKRIAELIIEEIARRSRTNFSIVRFGNVLGSNGSVVPRFMEQIKAGRPVTVTHPEVRRYFMLIPEAVQLVLQAATLGEQGAMYVLDMGEQIKVVDLARHLIRLAGFVPDDEIGIKFIGLRAGEKLVEELIGPDETAEPTSVSKIFRVRPKACAAAKELLSFEANLERCAFQCDAAAVMNGISKLIPSFPSNHGETGMVQGNIYTGHEQNGDPDTAVILPGELAQS